MPPNITVTQAEDDEWDVWNHGGTNDDEGYRQDEEGDYCY